MATIIKVENVNYVYQRGTPFECYALKDVSLSIEKGEKVSIIGPTGSGKSTLIQLFNGLLSPHSGKVEVAGKDINKSDQPICFEVGLVFQYPEYQLFEETVFDDIAFGPRNMKISEDEVEGRVRKSMEWMDLDFETMKDRSPFGLSGGEMRRVALAGVLAMRPGVLVLDEPTAGLDPRGKKDLFGKILDLHEELDMTVVMVTHEMGDAARMSDHLIIMNNGGIAADGATFEIFKKHDLLKKIGLDIPPVMELMSRLKSAGFDVNPDIMDLGEAAREILSLSKKVSEGKRIL